VDEVGAWGRSGRAGLPQSLAIVAVSAHGANSRNVKGALVDATGGCAG
jgi:hypothetical protein